MDWRYLKKGLLTASGKSPDLSRRYVVARDLQCGGTWQSPPPEDAKECVPGPQPGLFRGSYCSGHAPRIASRRPRANHSGVTPGTQGIHMTQNLYYSVSPSWQFLVWFGKIMGGSIFTPTRGAGSRMCGAVTRPTGPRH